jgi:hypothetical protein
VVKTEGKLEGIKPKEIKNILIELLKLENMEPKYYVKAVEFHLTTRP